MRGHDVYSTPDAEVRSGGILSWLMAGGIIFLAAANGFFTYSGALLFVEEDIYALLFAIAVQFAIAMTLLALPSVRGLGKPVLLMVYVGALVLSTLSAYVYVYNASLPGDLHSNAVPAGKIATLSDRLAEAMQQEQRRLDLRFQQVEQIRRNAEEEATRGLNSGFGPGKGREYFRKLEEYEAGKTELQLQRQRLGQAESEFASIRQRLEDSTAPSREQLVSALASLRAQLQSAEANALVTATLTEELGDPENPLEVAINSLRKPEHYTPLQITSLVWAAIFDLLALFLGIIRYYLLHTSKPMLERLHEAAVGFFSFFIQISNARSEARLRHRSRQSLYERPLNSLEMQNFATYLLSGSQMSMLEGGTDSVEPLQTVIRKLEPMHMKRKPNAVGIPWEKIGLEPRLTPLVAMLVQSGILINDATTESFILNPADDMGQKVMVLMRLGMKDAPENMANTEFLRFSKQTGILAQR